ncbi:hypothetical protein pb186bvf_019516 [Paramecium bursaria]
MVLFTKYKHLEIKTFKHFIQSNYNSETFQWFLIMILLLILLDNIKKVIILHLKKIGNLIIEMRDYMFQIFKMLLRMNNQVILLKQKMRLQNRQGFIQQTYKNKQIPKIFFRYNQIYIVFYKNFEF